MKYDPSDYTFYARKFGAFTDTDDNGNDHEFVLAKHIVNETWICWDVKTGPFPYSGDGSVIIPDNDKTNVFSKAVSTGYYVVVKCPTQSQSFEIADQSPTIQPDTEKDHMLRKLQDGITFLDTIMESTSTSVVTRMLTNNGDTVIDDLKSAYSYFSKN